MCLKNVNITIIPCLETSADGKSLIGLFDSVVASKNVNGVYSLNKICLFVNMSIILPKDEAKPHDNEIEMDSDFDVVIKLTHVDAQKGKILAGFTMKLDSSEVVNICRQFWEFHRIITVEHFELNGLGQYAIKIFIRKKNTERWTVQAIHCFNVQGG